MQKHVLLANTDYREEFTQLKRKHHFTISLFIAEKLHEFHQHLTYLWVQGYQGFVLVTAIISQLVQYIEKLFESSPISDALVVVVELSEKGQDTSQTAEQLNL
jgi:hypothetical protein